MSDIKRRVLRVDQQLPTYYAFAQDVVIGNGKSMISILNADTSLIVSIREIYIVNATVSAVTGVIGKFRLIKMTGHSSGTTITPVSMDSNDSLDSDITVKTGATISGEASTDIRRWQFSTDDWGTGTSDVESSDHVQQELIPVYKASGEMKPIILRQNEGVHIKQATNSTAGTFDLVIVFTVE